MNEWTAQANRGQGNDPHTQVVGTFLTCVPVSPHTSNAFSFDAATKFNAMPTAPSLDHVCAKQLSPNGTPLFMRVGNSSDSPQSGISYSAGNEPFPGVGSPAQAFSNLTGLFMSGGGEPMNEDTFQSVKGASILDLIKADLETLERYDMSASDKEKLAKWKALLDDTGKLVGPNAQCDQMQADALGLTQANVDMASMGSLGADRVAQQITDELDAADIYANVAVLAAACNANPVIFLKFPGNYVYRGLGLELENHGISHRIGNANMGGQCVAGVNDMITTMDKYHAEKFAHLVGALDSIPEGDGTLLDNCAATWLQEMSDGNAHNLNNLPIVLAGSCGGYFKMGQAINVEDQDPNFTRGNSIGPCANGGTVSATETGTDKQFGNMPINKYYCNLMNAIGVKAGADGFPAEGGSQEVTHYGMYDQTEDFATGGSAPANISNPGAFEDLKA
jgi:hypothetical protein